MLFSQAADVFLFGGATPAGRVRGEVVSTGEGTREVVKDLDLTESTLRNLNLLST